MTREQRDELRRRINDGSGAWPPTVHPLAVLALLDALDAAERTWQRIETAPKNATWVLIGWTRTGPGWHPEAARFVHGHWVDEDGERFTPPTHWQPLPPNPEPN